MRNADMFTIDVFEKLNKLNMTLQKKKLFEHEMWKYSKQK